MRTNRPVFLLRHFSVIFLLLIVGIIAGCHQSSPGTSGPLGLPAENKVRILSRSVGKTTDSVHWKWSLIGERNWLTTANKAGVVSLEKTMPLNDPEMKGSCNIWEVDLTVQQAGADLNWQTRLHGSNGVTADDRGTVPGTLDSVHIDSDKDVVLELPANATLAHVGPQEIKWRVAR